MMRPREDNALHDEIAEVMVIGACLINMDGDASEFDDATDMGITDESFYVFKHKVIWLVMEQIRNALTPLDESSVMSYIASHTLEKLRGFQKHKQGREKISTFISPSDLMKMSEKVESTGRVSFWCEVLKDREMLRRTHHMGKEIQQEAISGRKTGDELRALAEQRVIELSAKDAAPKASLMSEMIAARTKEILATPEPEILFRTGFIDIDRKVQGISRESFIVLGARPSTGKTTLGFQLVANIGMDMLKKQKTYSGLFFSLESPKSQIVDRAICCRAKVPLNTIRNRIMGQSQRDAIARSADVVDQLSIHIDDSTGLDIYELRSRARQHKRKYGLDCILIDHFHKIRPVGEHRQSALREISSGLADLRKELDCLVICLVQLNRESEKEDRLPRMSDLRECGALEEDADYIWFLDRYKDPKTGVDDGMARRMTGCKARDGEATWSELLTFQGHIFRFDNHIGERSGY